MFMLRSYDSSDENTDEVLEFDDQINDSSNINDAPHDSELSEDQHEHRDTEPEKKEVGNLFRMMI